jgi:hypothetical protein
VIDLADAFHRLSSAERKWLIATPKQFPADAASIAAKAGVSSAHSFASFARRNAEYFQRHKEAGSWAYRLSPLGGDLAYFICDTPTSGQQTPSPTKEAGAANNRSGDM